MKSIIRKQTFIQLLLLVLAIAFGASSAMAFDTTPSTELGARADEAGLDTDLTGGILSLTNMELANLTVEQIDQYVGSFFADAFVLDGIVRSCPNVIKNENNKITYYRFAQKVRKYALPTGQGILQSDNVSVKTITLSSSIAKAFKKTDIVHFLKVPGYGPIENGSQKQRGWLNALVTATTDTSITIKVINGIAGTDGTTIVFPTVAAGKNMLIGTNAMAESQKILDPYMVGMSGSEKYLQKQGFNIVQTEKEMQAALKLTGMSKLVEASAIKEHRRGRTYNLILGAQGDMMVAQDGNMGSEYVRFSDGILAQTKIAYTIDDTTPMSEDDLLGVSKAQHANIFSSHKSVCICGRDRIEKISKIKFFKTTDVGYQELNIGSVIKSYEDAFGRIEFKYEPLMDEMGMENIGIIFEPDNAVRYVSRGGDTKKEDVTGREAQRTIFIEEDAYFLRDYSSMLIGSSEDILDLESISNPEVTITDVATLPTTPTDGEVVHLTADAGGFESGSILIYSATTEKWSHYEGIINKA